LGRVTFYRLIVLNVAMLAIYSVADITEWNAIQLHPGIVESVHWSPLLIVIAYVGDPSDGRLINYLALQFWNWSFMVLLAIVAVNLAYVWGITRNVNR